LALIRAAQLGQQQHKTFVVAWCKVDFKKMQEDLLYPRNQIPNQNDTCFLIGYKSDHKDKNLMRP